MIEGTSTRGFTRKETPQEDAEEEAQEAAEEDALGAPAAGSIRPEIAAGLRRTVGAIAFLVTAAALGSCGPGSGRETPLTAPADSRQVSFLTSDGTELSGRLFEQPGAGTSGVVLAHMYTDDQRAWFGYAEELAAAGYRVLTFDFRGYCPGGDGGCSAGEKNPSAAPEDVTAAIGSLRASGAEQVALIGASFGGTAALVAASDPVSGPVTAVATLSAPARFEGMDAAAALPEVPAPTLFIAGIDDTNAVSASEELYGDASEPKRIEIVTSGDHGTDLLTGGQGTRVKLLLTAFLGQFATTPRS